MAEKLRNWIEELTGRQIAWVTLIGTNGGRQLYEVVFLDGTQEDWILDYKSRTGEQYERR